MEIIEEIMPKLGLQQKGEVRRHIQIVVMVVVAAAMVVVVLCVYVCKPDNLRYHSSENHIHYFLRLPLCVNSHVCKYTHLYIYVEKPEVNVKGLPLLFSIVCFELGSQSLGLTISANLADGEVFRV